MSSLDALRARFAHNEGLPFADILTEANIREVLNDHGVKFRDRVFSPVTTIWGFLSQVLNDDHSCRDAVSRIVAHRAANGKAVCSPNTASYCNARSRIPSSVFSTLAARTAQELEMSIPERFDAGHAGEPKDVPAAANATARDRFSASSDWRALVAGHRRLSQLGHCPVQRQGHRRNESLPANVRHA